MHAFVGRPGYVLWSKLTGPVNLYYFRTESQEYGPFHSIEARRAAMRRLGLPE